MTILQMMAEVAPSINSASGEGSWVTTKMMIAIFTGLAAVMSAYQLGKKKNMHITNSPLEVRKASDYVSQEDFDKLEVEVRAGFLAMQTRMEEERGIARKANGTIHQRIDKTQEMVSEVKGTLNVVNHNVETVLDHLLGHNNPPKRPTK